MNRTTPMKQGAPMKRTGFLRTQIKELGAVVKIKRAIGSRGMAGRTPTAAERIFMNAMASLGCVACAKDGNVNPWVSLHHIDGRTKPGAHFEVLPLCAAHHQQDDSDPAKRLSVHGRKESFVAMYGTEYELLAEAKAKLGLS